MGYLAIGSLELQEVLRETAAATLEQHLRQVSIAYTSATLVKHDAVI